MQYVKSSSRAVVKIGGSLLDFGLKEIYEDVSDIYRKNSAEFVIIHGGGDRVTAEMKRRGIEPRFITTPSGFRSRYNDPETIKVFVDVMCNINEEIADELKKYGVSTCGLCGKETPVKAVRRAGIINCFADAKGRMRQVVVRDDYSGKIQDVDGSKLESLLQSRIVPIISPVGIDEEYNLLNIDGDTVAAYVGKYIKAKKMIDFTDVDGFMENGKLVGSLKYSELADRIEKAGQGMKRKLSAAKEAIEFGLEEVIIANGVRKNPVSAALEHKQCTVVAK